MASILQFNSNFNQLKFTKDGNDLIISVKNSKYSKRYTDYFADENNNILVLAKDSNIAHSLKKEMVLNIKSTKDSEGNYRGDGTKYMDNIKGSAYDDIITGGKKNDRLTGGKGKDTFFFNPGDGVDTITDGRSEDVIHIEGDLSKLAYTRIGNDLEISYTDNDKIILTNFFKNKSSKNIDFIKNLSGETQLEYEDYINNPPYEESFYLNQYQRIYILKIFMSEDGYELYERSILKDATIKVNDVSKYSGSDYNEYVTAVGKNGKFSLGNGNDTLVYSDNFGKSEVTLGEKETLNLVFNNLTDFDCKLSGDKLIITTENGDSIVIKNHLKRKYATLKINGKTATSYKQYVDLFKSDASDFVNGKFTGTDLDDNINASDYESKDGKKGVTINSKSGNDTIVGSNYNDVIKSNSYQDEKTTVTENGGNNKITTGKGNDIITANNDSSNTINAGSGNNKVYVYSTGVNNIICGNGNDKLYINNGTNTINAGSGFNTINLSGGENTAHSGKDRDVYNVGSGHHVLYSGDGNDTFDVYGGSGVLYGEAGDDTYDFMDYYNYSTHNFAGNYTVDDSKGSNRLVFSDQMITDLNPVEMDNGTVTLLSRMSGKTMIYFDVTLDKNGNGITGKDLLFTNAHTFTGFNDTGIHVTDKDSISTIEAVHLEHLLYAYNYGYIDDEDYQRPNWGQFASARYTLNFDELTQKVAGWLTDSNTNPDGFKSAMEVFTKGSEAQITELINIYIDNNDSCYTNIK